MSPPRGERQQGRAEGHVCADPCSPVSTYTTQLRLHRLSRPWRLRGRRANGHHAIGLIHVTPRLNVAPRQLAPVAAAARGDLRAAAASSYLLGSMAAPGPADGLDLVPVRSGTVQRLLEERRKREVSSGVGASADLLPG